MLRPSRSANSMRPFAFLIEALVCAQLCCYAVDWRPLDPADIALKSPRIDPQADAEALFWDILI